jgi:hypothetical protein
VLPNKSENSSSHLPAKVYGRVVGTTFSQLLPRSNILIKPHLPTSYSRNKVMFTEPVLRIHDILVWIRIRIRESMPHTNGSGSFCFHHLPSRCQQKTNLKKFFCILLFEGTFASFFKGKKSKRSHKTVEIKVFLTIFA